MRSPTKHVLTAEMPVPGTYYQAQDNAVFGDSMQGDLSPWHAGSGVTISRAFNDLTRRQEMRVVSTVVGAGTQGQFTIDVPTLGIAYRFALRVWSPTPGMKVTVPLRPYTPTSPPSRQPGQQYPVGLQPVDLELTLTQGGGTYTFTAQMDVIGELYVQAFAMYPAAPSTSLSFKPVLAPTDATLTLDEGWAPYCQASLTCAIPDGDVLAFIDPRKNLRIKAVATRSGAESMVIADLDQMVTQATPTRYNLAARPRSNDWTGPGSWGRSALSGPTISPPNGVEGGSRFIAGAAPVGGEAFVLDTPTSLPAGVGAQVTVYARSGPQAGTVRLSVTLGSTTITSDPQELLGSHWCRLRLDVPVALATSSARITLTLDNTARPVGTVVDVTQVMITQYALRGTNLDGANPSFEKPLTGAGGGSASNTIDDTWSDQGGFSLKTVAASTNTSAYYVYGTGTVTRMMRDMGMQVGKTYTISATCRLTAAQGTAGLSASARKIIVNTVSGTTISPSVYASSPAAPNAAGITRLKVTFTIPTGADELVLRLYNGSATPGDTVWWDSLMVEEGTTAGVWSDGWAGGFGAPELGEYFDGSIGRIGDPVGFPVWTGPSFDSITAKVSSGIDQVNDFTALFGGGLARTNRVLNPSLEPTIGSWTPVNATLIQAAGGYVGASYGILTATVQGPYVRSNVIPAAAGTKYAASCWIRGSAGAAARMRITFWTGNGTGTATTVQGPSVTITGTWQRISVTGVVPAGNTSMQVGPSAALANVGAVLSFDGVLCELGTDQVGTYFDGDTPDLPASAGGWDYGWTGTPGASTSTAAPIYRVSYLSDLFADQYGYTLDPAANQRREFDLMLRGRSLDYEGGTMTLDLASDEALMQDFGRTASTIFDPPALNTSLRVLVNWALGLIGAGLDPAPPVVQAGIPPEDQVWEIGQSLWEFIEPLVTGQGFRLWCNEKRVWRLDEPVDGRGGNVSIGGLVDLDDRLDREGWADQVVLEHEYTDATGNDISKYATSNLVATPTRTVMVTKHSHATPTTAGANAIAKKTKTRGRVVAARAVSDYSITPNQLATFVSVVTLIDPLMVSAVSWSFPDATMRISTRDLPL